MLLNREHHNSLAILYQHSIWFLAHQDKPRSGMNKEGGGGVLHKEVWIKAAIAGDSPYPLAESLRPQEVAVVSAWRDAEKEEGKGINFVEYLGMSNSMQP